MSDAAFSIKLAAQLAIFMTNWPGSLAGACRECLVILRPSDVKKAQRVLRDL